MKVAVLYDFGVSKGGGDFVMLNILQALSDAGYEVSLLTSNPKGLYESAELFGKSIPAIEIIHVKVPDFLRHPYTIAYIARKVERFRNDPYDLYITSDDIPKQLVHKRGLCYIHYPHAARFRFKEYIATKYEETLRGKLIWKLHKFLFPRHFLTFNPPQNWLLIANSIVTKKHTAKVFGVSDKNITLLNPPVSSIEINNRWKNNSVDKEDRAVCVGRFESKKKFKDVLYALAYLKGKLKLSLIGFAGGNEAELAQFIKDLKLENDVELLINTDRKTLIDRLIRAKAIVHPAPYEPFGIAVIEGMAAGCVPIVRRGFNGPWMEITQEGRYGLGFESIGELASMLKEVIEYYDSFNIKAIISRALEFDEAKFKQSFTDTLKNFIAT